MVSSPQHLAPVSSPNSSLPEYIKPRDESPAYEDRIRLAWPKRRLTGVFLAAAFKAMDFGAGVMFRQRHDIRALFLESIAVVPGAVAASEARIASARGLKYDKGRTEKLMDEAANEHMHLMIMKKVAKPNAVGRFMIAAGVRAFHVAYAFAYAANKEAAHGFMGILEKGAVGSYQKYIKAIDEGRMPNPAAPQIAIDYYPELKQMKTRGDKVAFRDVLVCIQRDEQGHAISNDSMAVAIMESKTGKKAPPPAKPS